MKLKTFESIIRKDFRWPRKGDLPFVVDAEPRNNALISGQIKGRMYEMITGYKSAADLMVAHVEKNSRERDILVCPIIFCYRHYLELSIKDMLSVYGSHVGISENWKTHSLTVLWHEYEEMLRRFGTTDPDEADPIVGEVVAEFAKIDPKSDAYRYPIDNKGNALPLSVTELHLPTLMDVMSAVSNYFGGSDGYLDSLVSAV